MRNFRLFWVVFLLVAVGQGEALAAKNFVAPENLFESKVVKVIDGDTIRLEDGRLVRYLGIDAPELRKKVDSLWVYDPQPFAEAAAQLNRQLVEGKKVIIELDPALPRKDKFGRLLAFVFVDKVMVNEELVKRGLAKAETHHPLIMKYRKRIWSLEEAAWTGKRGLWAEQDKP